MRSGLIMILLLFLSACTSMLIGSASSGDGRPAVESRSSAQVADDNAISATLSARLTADAMVGKYAIGIRTADNAVTLSGTVGSFAARDRAVQIANSTDGVRNVTNRIVVNTNL